MSVHYEWINVQGASVEVAKKGDEFGDASVDDHAVVLGGDDVVIIEGSPAELRTFGRRMAGMFADTDTGPAVTFDRDAFRRWCAAPELGNEGTRGEWAGLGGVYNSFDDEASRLVERVLFDLRGAPQVWRRAAGVGHPSIWPTADAEDYPDGGGVVTFTVDGIELSAGHLQAGDLVYGDTDDDGRLRMPALEAVEMALAAVATAVNAAAARFRAVTGTQPAPATIGSVVHVVAHVHKRGQNLSAFTTPEGADAYVAQVVREGWHEVADCADLPEEPPADDDEARRLYFENHPDEWVCVDVVKVAS